MASSKGSSVGGLRLAAEEHGLYAATVGGIDTEVLRQSPYPVILHVKARPESRDYEHYELFLGTEGGRARLFDPPNPVQLVPFHELAARWGGSGVVVSPEPFDVAAVVRPMRTRVMTYAAIGIVAVVLAHLARRRWWPAGLGESRRDILRLSSFQRSLLAGSAVLGGLVYHTMDDEGLLAHAQAAAGIQRAHIESLVGHVEIQELAGLLKGDTVFIDARSSGAYEKGHLPGAINVSTKAGPDQRRESLAGIARNARVVVYCNAAHCSAAGTVGATLLSHGFTNVSLYKGGWKEWSKAMADESEGGK